MTERVPRLAVVGHPNKGKSSIVAALVEDDALLISPLSGTTRDSQNYDFERQGQRLFSLFDTPGFQRPRPVLSWLKREPVAAAQRPERIRQFLAEPDQMARFPDEVALLTPIMAGAAILYVVDISLPYGPEFDAEMEILAWTGQPRMALMNPIHGNGHQAEWQRALDQYFQHSQIFNPLTANLSERLALFNSFSRLQAVWRPVFELLQQSLRQQFVERYQQSLSAIADYWRRQMQFQQTLVPGEALLEPQIQQFYQRLEQHEQQLFERLKTLWHFPGLAWQRDKFHQLDSSRLMQQEDWYLWGLSEWELYSLSSLSGAAVGGAIGVAAAGISAVAGVLVGGLVGGVSGWWAARRLPGSRWGWLLSGTSQSLGPVQHPNFPLVVMARALSMAQALMERSHAQRTPLALNLSDAHASSWSTADQLQLGRWAQALQQEKARQNRPDALIQWIARHLPSAGLD